MEAAAAALGLIGTIIKLAEEAKTASKEQHDAIVAKLLKTAEELSDAILAAQLTRAEESQLTQDAIDKAKQTP